MPPQYRGRVTDQANVPIQNAKIAHTCPPTQCPGGNVQAQTDAHGYYTLDLPNPVFTPHEITCTKDGYSFRAYTPDVGIANQTVPIQLDFVVNRLVNGIPAECLDQWYSYRRASRDYRVGKLQSNAQQLFNAADQAYNNLLDALRQQGIENPHIRVQDVLYYRTTANEIRPRKLDDGFD